MILIQRRPEQLNKYMLILYFENIVISSLLKAYSSCLSAVLFNIFLISSSSHCWEIAASAAFFNASLIVGSEFCQSSSAVPNLLIHCFQRRRYPINIKYLLYSIFDYFSHYYFTFLSSICVSDKICRSLAKDIMELRGTKYWRELLYPSLSKLFVCSMESPVEGNGTSVLFPVESGRNSVKEQPRQK